MVKNKKVTSGICSPDTFLSLGGKYLNRELKPMSDYSIRRFVALFGCTPCICSIMFKMMVEIGVAPAGFLATHLLMGLLFMKVYSTEVVHAGMAGVTEKTFRKHSWNAVKTIADLYFSTINFENRLRDRPRNGRGRRTLLSVDGTDYKIRIPKPFWKGWFSFKFRGPGLRYEIALSIQRGDICWTNGPYPCGKWPDISVFRDGLKNMLKRGEKVEADFGYRGEKCLKTPADHGNNELRKIQKSRVRSRQEHVNKRFKQFNCLKHVWRHERHLHFFVFDAIAVITQLEIENGSPLWQPDYDWDNN